MHGKNIAGISGILLFISLTAALSMPTAARNQDRKPSAAAAIQKAFEAKGIEAAREEFAALFKNRSRYIFEEEEFISLGYGFLKAREPLTAVEIFTMAVEAFPGSLSALRLLAHAHYMSGDEESSLKTQKRMMSARGEAELADFLDRNTSSLAHTAEEVIERSIRATGGREAWEAVKTMVVIFSLQDTRGEQPRMVRMYKRPCFFRQGLEGASDFTATDGTTFWSVRGREWNEITNFHIRLASMDRWLLDYERMGISCEFSGFDHINGSPVYHLRRTFRDGFEEDLYFSTATNLLTEVRSDYIQHIPFMKSFMSYWNYRAVDGIKIPFVFIRNTGSLAPPHGGVVEEVRINEPLDDALFLPPDYKKSQP